MWQPSGPVGMQCSFKMDKSDDLKITHFHKSGKSCPDIKNLCVHDKYENGTHIYKFKSDKHIPKNYFCIFGVNAFRSYFFVRANKTVNELVNMKYVEWHEAVNENDTTYGTKYYVDDKYISLYNQSWYNLDNRMTVSNAQQFSLSFINMNET